MQTSVGSNCGEVTQETSRWKSKLLTTWDRLTLWQSTLYSLPVYFMSLFTILGSIASHLEKIMRDFSWSSRDSNNSFYWDVCHPKHKGSLGIRRLLDMNEALKGKWFCRLAKGEDAL